MFLGILDFEANCVAAGVLKPQEIIEVPVVVYDCASRRVVEGLEFHSYCKPTVPITAFCAQLTGITADTVKDAPDFRTVYKQLLKWYHTNGWSKDNFVWVTCGNWDLGTALPNQASHSGIKVNSMFREWTNVKDVFKALVGHRAGGMPEMLSSLNLTLQGRHHSGIDDARNIARCVKALDDLAHSSGQQGIWHRQRNSVDVNRVSR